MYTETTTCQKKNGKGVTISTQLGETDHALKYNYSSELCLQSLFYRLCRAELFQVNPKSAIIPLLTGKNTFEEVVGDFYHRNVKTKKLIQNH
ncbi:4-hydroxy-tetrahydrodipicolinate reductase [Dirofilaria immitis]